MPSEITVWLNLQPQLLCWLECVPLGYKMRQKITQQCLNYDNIFAMEAENVLH
jgi:hypothetical protein